MSLYNLDVPSELDVLVRAFKAEAERALTERVSTERKVYDAAVHRAKVTGVVPPGLGAPPSAYAPSLRSALLYLLSVGLKHAKPEGLNEYQATEAPKLGRPKTKIEGTPAPALSAPDVYAAMLASARAAGFKGAPVPAPEPAPSPERKARRSKRK